MSITLGIAQEADVLERTRAVIRAELEAGTLQMLRVAKLMAMSERTLRRRLEERDTTYQDLVDEIRCELALSMLKQGSVSTRRISERLGYSDSTTFHRAFRRWTGNVPSSFKPGAVPQAEQLLQAG